MSKTRRAIAVITILLLIVPGVSHVVPEAGGRKKTTNSDWRFTEGAIYSSEKGAAERGRGAGGSGWDLDKDGISDLLEKRMKEEGVRRALLTKEGEWNERDLERISEKIRDAGARIVETYEGPGVVETADISLDELRSVVGATEGLEGWHRGTRVWYGDVQTRNIKARESEEYSPETAWELGYEGKGVTIAIMDTGADDEHPSLSGKWVGGADISKPETFLTPRDGSYNADDTQGHGTTCSGIAMGTGAPSGEYRGAAPGAGLVDLRIGTAIGYAPGELFQDAYDASLQGAQWVLDHRNDEWESGREGYEGIDVLSLSWGIDVGGPSDGKDPYSLSLDRIVDSGVHVVVAAGNDGPDNDGFHGMGAADGVITVAATDDNNTVDRGDDIIAYYSSRGPRTDDGDGERIDELKPDVAASGTNIKQVVFSRNPLDDASGNGYGNRGSGTSYATPSVAGVVAMMLEANPDLSPKITKEILRATAERRGEASMTEVDPFWNRDFGWGIVDAYKAVSMAEAIGNPGEIDPDLQCFITNITSEGGRNVAKGIAWSRSGAGVEKIVLGGWGGSETLTIEGSKGSAADTPADTRYINWTAEFTTSKEGVYNISAVAVRGNKQSLPSTSEVYLERSAEGRKTPFSPSAVVAMVVVVGIVIALSVMYYYRISKKRRPPETGKKSGD